MKALMSMGCSDGLTYYLLADLSRELLLRVLRASELCKKEGYLGIELPIPENSASVHFLPPAHEGALLLLDNPDDLESLSGDTTGPILSTLRLKALDEDIYIEGFEDSVDDGCASHRLYTQVLISVGDLRIALDMGVDEAPRYLTDTSTFLSEYARMILNG